jgi:hypothetical protein
VPANRIQHAVLRTRLAANFVGKRDGDKLEGLSCRLASSPRSAPVRLVDCSAQGGDARDLVYRRSDDGEVEALYVADIAIEYDAKMETVIHVGCRQALRSPAFVDSFDRLAGLLCGVECGDARAGAIFAREDSEHAIPNQLQNVARMFVDG